VPWIPVEDIYSLEDCNAITGVHLAQSPQTGVPDRTSTRWWQRLAAQTDLIVFLNKKIAFVNPTGEDTGPCAIGSILVAMGEQAVAGLIAASQKGLGVAATPFADKDQDRSPTTIAEEPE
jgi:hypothetical protein